MCNGDQVSLGETILGLNGLEASNTEWNTIFTLEEHEVVVEVTVINCLDFDRLCDEFGNPKSKLVFY